MTGHRLNALSRRVLAVCTQVPQSMGEIIAKLPDEDKDKIALRVHRLVAEGFLQNHRSVRSYGGLYSLPTKRVREVRQPTLTGTSTFALYDVWK